MSTTAHDRIRQEESRPDVAMEASTDVLATLQTQISSGQLLDARKTLRYWLSLQLPPDQNASSLSDWMQLLAETGDHYIDVASVLIRCSAVQGLLEPNNSNHIERSLIDITSRSLPRLITYLRVDSREQNYLKYQKLSTAHDIAIQHLEPIYRPYGDIQALVDGRNRILGSLAHNAFKDYLKCFGLDEIRSDIENIFGVLHRIVNLEDTLFDDLEACQASIHDAELTCEKYQSFLTQLCLAPFLTNVESVLQRFLERMQDRFSARIALAIEGHELKKRYPLHEVDRELTISLPLRNDGPGRAIDVRVTCEDSDDSVDMTSLAVVLGNVAAGDFEVNYDCRILKPCTEMSFIIRVEWAQVASSRRQSDTFLVQILAQASDVQWSELQYSSRIARK